MIQPINAFAINTLRIVAVAQEREAQDLEVTLQITSTGMLEDEALLFGSADIAAKAGFTVHGSVDAAVACTQQVQTSLQSRMFVTTKPKDLECNVLSDVYFMCNNTPLLGVTCNVPVTTSIQSYSGDILSNVASGKVRFSSLATMESSPVYWKQDTPALRIGKYVLLDEAIGRIKIPFDPYL